MHRFFFIALALIAAGCAAASTPAIPSNHAPPRPATGTATGRRVYKVPANACQITSCTNAPLLAGGVAAGTLSYAIGLGNGGVFGNTTFGGSLVFSGTVYGDFKGTFADVGSVSIGGLSWQIWRVAGTFDRGYGRVDERFHVRGHSGRGGGNTIVNAGGIVTTPYVTPPPTPTPAPTPVPTPTDS